MKLRHIVLEDELDKSLKKLSYEKDLSVSALIRIALKMTYNLPDTFDMTNLKNIPIELLQPEKETK